MRHFNYIQHWSYLNKRLQHSKISIISAKEIILKRRLNISLGSWLFQRNCDYASDTSFANNLFGMESNDYLHTNIVIQKAPYNHIKQLIQFGWAKLI